MMHLHGLPYYKGEAYCVHRREVPEEDGHECLDTGALTAPSFFAPGTGRAMPPIHNAYDAGRLEAEPGSVAHSTLRP